MQRFSLRTAASLLAIALAIAASAGLATAKPKPVKNLWATINICDTKKHPNKVGVRGRMPGNGNKNQTMYLQVNLQYMKSGKWVHLNGGTSKWLKAGKANFSWGENGATFTINIKAGQSFTMRGRVFYEWREGSKVVRNASRYTTSGHPSTKSDPEGYSAATCVVKG